MPGNAGTMVSTSASRDLRVPGPAIYRPGIASSTLGLAWGESSLEGGTMTHGRQLGSRVRIDSKFNAYADDTGRRLWSTSGSGRNCDDDRYGVAGRQYVTVGGQRPPAERLGVHLSAVCIDLPDAEEADVTFTLDGTAVVPANTPPQIRTRCGHRFSRRRRSPATRGEKNDALYCAVCHASRPSPAAMLPTYASSADTADG